MPAVLDHTSVPHIFDSILGFSSHATLTVIARTSKPIRQRVFDKYLPVDRIILHKGRRQFFGVDKDLTAVPLDWPTVTAHRSLPTLIDILGPQVKVNENNQAQENKAAGGSSVEFKNIPVRFVPSDCFDMFIAAAPVPVSDSSNGIRQEWSVALPLWSDLGSGLELVYMLGARFSALFDVLASPGPGARVAFLMLDNPAITDDWQLVEPQWSMFTSDFKKWLWRRVLPVDIVFVNIEGWFKPGGPAAEARNNFFTVLKALVTAGVTGPDSEGVTGLKAATFMTLDEYKNEMGEESFELRTRFVKPIFA